MGFFDKLIKTVSDAADLVGNAVKSAVDSTTTAAKQFKEDMEASTSYDWHVRLKYYLSQETPDYYASALRLIDFHQCQEPSLIDAWKSAIMAHPEDERKSIFNKQFDVVDEALRKGDIQMLHLSLASINQLAAQSPFKNLADIAQVQSALMDDDTVWDI